MPIDPQLIRRILELSELEGSRKIAKRLGISRKVIRRILESKSAPKPQGKLDPFLEKIDQKVNAGLTTVRILREIQELGYQGGRTILAQYVSQKRSQQPIVSRRKVKRRFETPPGAELQVDWSPGWAQINGKRTKIHVLGMVMGYSRKLFFSIFQDERSPTFLEGLAQGFASFEGVAFRAVFDNMSTVTLGRIGSDRKAIWNQRFLEFSQHYGFEPFLCAVADPDRKGKKEKSFRLVFDDFIKGSEFASWDDMLTRLRIWLNFTPGVGNLRVHGTTGLVPNEAFLVEKPLLIALPAHRFPCYEEVIRAVDADSTISVRGVRYTVPAVLAFRQIPVRLHADHFEVLDNHGRIHLSRRYLDPSFPGKLVIDPTHYASVKKRSREGDLKLDQAFLLRFPDLGPFVDGLKLKMKSIAVIHLRALLRLADVYGAEVLLAAAKKAQEHRRFTAYAIKRILERDFPPPPDDLSCTGIGATLLGEVEEADLNEYAYLDRQPATKKETDDDQK